MVGDVPASCHVKHRGASALQPLTGQYIRLQAMAPDGHRMRVLQEEHRADVLPGDHLLPEPRLQLEGLRVGHRWSQPSNHDRHGREANPNGQT